MGSGTVFIGNQKEAPKEALEMLAAADIADLGAYDCLVWVGDGYRGAETIVVPDVSRAVMLIGNNAHASFVWRLGAEKRYYMDVWLADVATAHVTTIAVAGDHPVEEVIQRGTVGRGGMIHWHSLTLGSIASQEIVSRCQGADARSSVDWMFYVKNQEQCSLNVHNSFEGLRGSGEVTMRGVAEDRGSGRCRGMIDIGLQGGGTNTYLTQEVLMLDPTAKVDAVPALEIKTNDVKASHSATISRVTPEDLFYFASRGIDQREARAMFVQGFLGALAEKIGDDSIREEIEGLIEEKYREAASYEL